MSAKTIPFPARGPFAVTIMRDGAAWLVVCRDHGWLHGSFDDANDDAYAVATGFAVQVKVKAK